MAKAKKTPVNRLTLDWGVTKFLGKPFFRLEKWEDVHLPKDSGIQCIGDLRSIMYRPDKISLGVAKDRLIKMVLAAELESIQEHLALYQTMCKTLLPNFTKRHPHGWKHIARLPC